MYHWHLEQNVNDYQVKQLFDEVRINDSIKKKLDEWKNYLLALNLTGGDFNSQIGLQSCSYEVSNEKRTTVPQPYRLVPPLPPIGPTAFTPRKCKYIQRELIK